MKPSLGDGLDFLGAGPTLSSLLSLGDGVVPAPAAGEQIDGSGKERGPGGECACAGDFCFRL